MSDKILLRHTTLNNVQFGSNDCKDVFAFREFSPEDSEELKQEVGIVCGRVAFEERMKGDSNYKALVYQVNPTRVLRYVFGTRGAMGCTYDDSTQTYYDPAENYYSSRSFTAVVRDAIVDERKALSSQFNPDITQHVCRRKGLLKHVVEPDKTLLYAYKLNKHYFGAFDCRHTYAFREAKVDVTRNMANEVAFCDKAKYLELLHGNTHFHALTYYKSHGFYRHHVYHTIEYVFASPRDMDCIMLPIVNKNKTRVLRYTMNNIIIRDMHFYNEKNALLSQFDDHGAYEICLNNGTLPYQIAMKTQHNVIKQDAIGVTQTLLPERCICPDVSNSTLSVSTVAAVISNLTSDNSTVLTNYTLSDNATTVPVSEMEFLTSAATVLLASPVLLAPVMLAINNLSEIFFDGLANLFTNLGRRR